MMLPARQDEAISHYKCYAGGDEGLWQKENTNNRGNAKGAGENLLRKFRNCTETVERLKK